jgi:hypothetical protein
LRTLLASLGGALFAGSSSVGAAPNSRETVDPGVVSAWIETDPVDAPHDFVGYARAAEPVSARYELTAEKVGPSGRSSSRQSGRVEIGSAAPIQLSRLSLGAPRPGDRYEIILTLYVGDRQVARDMVRKP